MAGIWRSRWKLSSRLRSWSARIFERAASQRMVTTPSPGRRGPERRPSQRRSQLRTSASFVAALFCEGVELGFAAGFGIFPFGLEPSAVFKRWRADRESLGGPGRSVWRFAAGVARWRSQWLGRSATTFRTRRSRVPGRSSGLGSGDHAILDRRHIHLNSCHVNECRGEASSDEEVSL